MTVETGGLPSDDLRSDEQSAGGGPGLAPRPIGAHPIWTGLLIAVLAVGLGACDLVPGLEPGDDRPGGADSLQIGLLKSGRVVTGLSGGEEVRVRHVAPLEERAAKRAGAGTFLGKPGHACTISLYRPDGPRGPGYYYRSARITYPDSVVEKAAGETMQLRAWMKRPSVPHASDLEALLQCRLPAVEGAERRVRSFFRFSEEQLRERGLRSADDSTRAGAGKARSIGGSDCEETTAVVCVRAYCGVKDTFGGCTDDGWGGGGAPQEHPEKNRRTLESTGVGGGSGDGGPDPGDNDCDSDNPPEWCDIGCKLSAAELNTNDLFTPANQDKLKTFINTLEKHGNKFGFDSQSDIKFFLGQVLAEGGGKITVAERLGSYDAEELRSKFGAFGPGEDGKYGEGEYKAAKYVGKPKEIANRAYAGRLGNGPPSSGDGWRYRGRGLIQLTGKYNYEQFTQAYQNNGFGSTDFTANPTKLSSNARAATISAMWYWKNRVIEHPRVDEDNLTVSDIGEAVNPGAGSYDYRRRTTDRVEQNVNCSN